MYKLLATQTQNGHEHLITFLGVHKLLATQTQNGHKHLVTFSGVRKLLATQTQNGHKNLVTLVDDHAREESIHGPRNKSQIGQAFKAFILQSTWQTFEVLGSSGGSEHMAGHLRALLHNASPNASPICANDSTSPEEAFSGNKLDVS